MAADPGAPSDEHHRLLDLAIAAARAAATVILDIYAQPFEVRHKADSSPVTLADERAEQVIVAALEAGAPDIPIFAEEEVARRGFSAAPPRFWLVDPLDGTREFVRRNGEFTVNIGLVEDEQAALGVVHLPVGGITYAGCGKGTATRRTGRTTPSPITARRPPATGAIVVHSRSHADLPRLDAYIAGLPGAQRRVSGSAVKFCLLAAGEADYYPRFGATMEWDTAAGQAVLEAAGGQVRTADGQPLRYAKPGLRNPAFIATGVMD